MSTNPRVTHASSLRDTPSTFSRLEKTNLTDMSLKRKASFPPNVAPVIAGPSVSMDDAPQHLHCRTRKRFRNDRPDDDTIYENTLRWLFTAQQRPVSERCIEPENGTENGESEPLPTPETVDPRQQTLFKFFKPAQSSSALPSSHMTAPSSGDALRDTTMGYNDSRSPSSRTGTDMDVDMDTDSGSDQSDLQKQGFGGFSWM